MCGLCGVFALDGVLDPALAAAMPAMTGTLAHRGPDGEGIFGDDRAILGHRRLAIIDRAGGHQPLSNEDGRCWVVFNGEIYNHRPLRHELIGRGHRFTTQSDTETIVHAFEEFGSGCVDRFNGMFAFAVYDQRRRELLLARDRLGKKPLYYAVFGGVLHFASEIKALEQSPLWNGTLDLSSIEGYLSLGYFLAPATVYRDVHVLEPGHILRVVNGRISVSRYWDVERFDTDRRPEREVLEELEAMIATSVRERLESEVPLGAFLSGGIDSGLVVSFMGETLRDRLVTTTVSFASGVHDETDAAAATARLFSTRHHVERVDAVLEQVLDPIVHAFDQPFADASAVPTYYVAAAARRHVTVALTGDGGDESFGGYDFRYVPHALEARARRFVPPASRGLLRWLGDRWPSSRRLPRPLRLGTILQNLSGEAAAAYYADLCFLKPGPTRALLGRPATSDPHDSPVFDAVTAPYRRCPSTSALQRAQYADLKVYLPNDVLVKVDRMSMQHSLEVRCPLLDHRIVEFAFRLPTETKLPGRDSKHLLRAIARQRLSEHVSALPKMGFNAPVASWLAGSCAERLRSDVFGSSSVVSGILDMTMLRRMFDEHTTGTRDHWYALWAVWMFERWARQRTTPRTASLMTGI